MTKRSRLALRLAANNKYLNAQKNPGKAYLLNRRVHHGEIGKLLGLSRLIKKSRPSTAGVLSGLGEALSQDDIADKEEWLSSRKKRKKQTWNHLQNRNETTMKKKNNLPG